MHTVSFSVIFKATSASGGVLPSLDPLKAFLSIRNLKGLNGLEKHILYSYSCFSKWKYFRVGDLFLLDFSLTSTICVSMTV